MSPDMTVCTGATKRERRGTFSTENAADRNCTGHRPEQNPQLPRSHYSGNLQNIWQDSGTHVALWNLRGGRGSHRRVNVWTFRLLPRLSQVRDAMLRVIQSPTKGPPSQTIIALKLDSSRMQRACPRMSSASRVNARLLLNRRSLCSSPAYACACVPSTMHLLRTAATACPAACSVLPGCSLAFCDWPVGAAHLCALEGLPVGGPRAPWSSTALLHAPWMCMSCTAGLLWTSIGPHVPQPVLGLWLAAVHGPIG